MRTKSVRFRIEVAIGCISALALALTLAWPQWLERFFGIDADGGSGSFEWGVSIALLACAVAMFATAQREWKRGALTAG